MQTYVIVQPLDAIRSELVIRHRWMDCRPSPVITDFDGTRLYLDPTPEEEAVERRIHTLEELIELRKPVGESWLLDMHFGWCCHPQPEEDPMGEMMGRNY